MVFGCPELNFVRLQQRGGNIIAINGRYNFILKLDFNGLASLCHDRPKHQIASGKIH
jgi:hypothetical protein